jgi:hypothetical protein
MASFLHTMVRITDPEKSRAVYETLGFRFERDNEARLTRSNPSSCG